MPHRGKKTPPQRRKSLTEKGISSTNTPERIAAGRAESQRRQALGRRSAGIGGSETSVRETAAARARRNADNAARSSRPIQSFARLPSQSFAGRRDLEPLPRQRFGDLGRFGRAGEVIQSLRKTPEEREQQAARLRDPSVAPGGLGTDILATFAVFTAPISLTAGGLISFVKTLTARTGGKGINLVDDIIKASDDLLKKQNELTLKAQTNALAKAELKLMADTVLKKSIKTSPPRWQSLATDPVNKAITQQKQVIAKALDAGDNKAADAAIKAVEGLELAGTSARNPGILKATIGTTAEGKPYTLFFTNRQASDLVKKGVTFGDDIGLPLNPKTEATLKRAGWKWLIKNQISDKVWLTKVILAAGVGVVIGAPIPIYLTYVNLKALSAISPTWGPGEGMEGLVHTARVGGESDDPEYLRQLAADVQLMSQGLANNPYEEGGVAWTKWNLNQKLPIADFQLQVNIKNMLDKADAIENGLSSEDSYLLTQIEIQQMKNESSLLFNEDKIATEHTILALREMAAKEQDRRTLQNIAAQIKLWEEYAARQRILEQQERERMAQFWLDYAKRKSSLGGLGFGFL